MRFGSLLPLALLLFASAPALAHGIVEVQGRVLDADGKPAPDARVAQAFVVRLGSLTSTAASRTDAAGHFQVRVHMHAGQPHALMAVGVDEERGAVAAISSACDLTNVELRLRPLCLVRGELLAVDLGGRRQGTLEAALPGGGAVVACTSGELGRFSLMLPVGSYHLVGRASVDHERWERDVTLGPDGVDLGEILLEGAPHTKYLGLVPPAWTVAAARHTDLPIARLPESLREEDFEGRWLVVGFFDARTPEGLTVIRLMVEFYNRHADQRRRLAMVGFHAPWAKTFAQVDAAAGKLDLPFPELLDPSGKTFESWGVGKESRILLLDPEGRLQRWDPDLLTERLAR